MFPSITATVSCQLGGVINRNIPALTPRRNEERGLAELVGHMRESR